MNVNKINPFSTQAMKGLQGINPSQQPVNAVKPVGKNPFEKHDQKSKYGVGLINSDLNNMYTKAPNGKEGLANTRWIA
ncbi:MAG TPA: hypothetical protein PKI94_03710 [Candidatus Gastranaerophilaceae bacterium]|nr:hypothetical protein [Candidatus Gastranaerophilaceae bacterium]